MSRGLLVFLGIGRCSDQDAFTEAGTAATELSVAGQSEHSFQTGLSVRVYQPASVGDNRVRPDSTVRWIHEHADVRRQVTAAFQGTATTFTVNGGAADRARVQIRAGATWYASERVSMDLSYELDAGGDSRLHAGLVRGAYMFWPARVPISSPARKPSAVEHRSGSTTPLRFDHLGHHEPDPARQRHPHRERGGGQTLASPSGRVNRLEPL